MINPLAISLLATGGETPDSYVVGNITLEKDRVQQFLHNLAYIVIRTLQFLSQQNGECAGRLRVKREQRISR